MASGHLNSIVPRLLTRRVSVGARFAPIGDIGAPKISIIVWAPNECSIVHLSIKGHLLRHSRRLSRPAAAVKSLSRAKSIDALSRCDRMILL